MSATPGVGTILPWEWSNNPPGPAPYTYEVPASLEVQPYTSTATFDGTDAGGNFVPVLSLYSQTGALLASVFPVGVVMAPGDVAEVTWLPPFGSAPSAAPSGSGIQFDTDNEGGWLDVTTNDKDGGGQGMDLKDTSGGGIIIQTSTGSGGPIDLEADFGMLLYVAGGDISLNAPAGSIQEIVGGGGSVTIGVQGGSGFVEVGGDGTHQSQVLIAAGPDTLGFYGSTAVVQPAAPTTLAEVIAVLSAAAGGCGITK